MLSCNFLHDYCIPNRRGYHLISKLADKVEIFMWESEQMFGDVHTQDGFLWCVSVSVYPLSETDPKAILVRNAQSTHPFDCGRGSTLDGTNVMTVVLTHEGSSIAITLRHDYSRQVRSTLGCTCRTRLTWIVH